MTTVAADRRSLPGLLTATGASVAANAVVAVLVPWLVLDRTGSPAQAGLVGAVALAAAVPALAALAFLVGAALGPLGPALAAITQIRTPPELRGRVVSTRWSLALVATPLGVLGAGLLLEWTDPGAALLAVAAGVLTTAVLAALSAGLRQAGPNTIMEVSS